MEDVVSDISNEGFSGYDSAEWDNPWFNSEQETDPEKSAEIWGDQPKRKWYGVQFSIYLTEEQASNVRLNFDHLANAMSKDFQGSEPVSPTYYIDAQAMFEEPVVKYRWWKRTRIWNWIRPAKIYRG